MMVSLEEGWAKLEELTRTAGVEIFIAMTA
jgi:hypothetical protein